jgi:uncharacterized protein YndB with AHSA1/START domain
MVDILHRVGVVAPLDDVYRAVATPEGIAGWWTTDTVGKSEVFARVLLVDRCEQVVVDDRRGGDSGQPAAHRCNSSWLGARP